MVICSTTLQKLATLHKLLPVHPSGHMLGVQICDVGETNASSNQLLTVCGVKYWALRIHWTKSPIGAPRMSR